MYARSEPSHYQSRLASGCGNLATPPELDYRNGKNSNQCVNRFQAVFLSELVLHYTDPSTATRAARTDADRTAQPSENCSPWRIIWTKNSDADSFSSSIEAWSSYAC